MMMNERVEIGGVKGTNAMTAIAGASFVDEKLVVLHRTLKRITKARAHLDLQEAEALREAQKLQLWKQFGHTSLVDYMIKELGYSSWRTAEDRLRLANALPELPKLTEAIQNGAINMTQARELARVATPETEEKWIEKALDLNVRQVEQAVAGHSKGDLPEDPVDPRLVRKTMYLSVRPETELLFREARKALEAERGERLDEDAVMEALCRAMLRPSTPCTPAGGAGGESGREDADASGSGGESGRHADGSMLCTPGGGAPAGAPYRIAVTLCKACKRGWQHGAGSLVEMSPPDVERAMCDAQWIGDLDSPLVERARQDISPATRRKVLHRDLFRCRVPGCRSNTNIDIHHIVHREHGGTNELSNLLSTCEAHHLAHHAGTLVIGHDGDEVTFRFEGRNRFTRKTREVATKEALRARGLERAHIRTVMARTVNTIGESDLSEEQWLAIALRYADERA